MKETVKIFLESGLLESYLLGMTNAEETANVEAYIQKYPAVKKAYKELEETIEEWATRQAVKAPAHVKGDVLNKIDELEPKAAKLKKLKSRRSFWSVAAAVTALIFSIVSLYFWSEKDAMATALAEIRNQNQQLETALVEQEEACNALEQKYHLLNDPATSKLILKGNDQAADFQAIAFWNPTTQQSFLNVLKMPNLPDQKCLQMWADVDGKMINIGVLKGQENELVAIPFKVNAESLNITIEPLGGSDHPTVTNLISSIPI